VVGAVRDAAEGVKASDRVGGVVGAGASAAVAGLVGGRASPDRGLSAVTVEPTSATVGGRPFSAGRAVAGNESAAVDGASEISRRAVNGTPAK